MLRACGFDAKSSFDPLSSSLRLHIQFKNGFIKDEGQAIKNRAFDKYLGIKFDAGSANLIIED